MLKLVTANKYCCILLTFKAEYYYILDFHFILYFNIKNYKMIL